MADSSANNKRIAKNTLFLYFRMLLIMAVTLYTSRVVLATLGVEDYGIYNIVGGIVVLFSFINSSLASATQRFLNFELGRGGNKTQRVFSMSLTIHALVAVIVAILAETVGLWFLNTQMNIPVERMNAANWAYQFSIFSVSISFIQVPYYASVIAYEKMAFFARIAILEVALKLLIVLILVYIGFDKLKLYSILTFCVSFVVFECYRKYCKKHIAFSQYTYFWDKKMFQNLLSFSGWMLLGAAAGVGSHQGINILLNIFCGVAVNAAVGISNQVNAAVNQFVSNFQTAFMPQIVKLYAAGDILQMRILINRSSRFSFFLLFMLACPLMLNIEFVLGLWLKEVPSHTSNFCTLILIYSLIETMSKPVGLAIHATGRVKNYNLLITLALSINIILSYVFLSTGYEPEIVMTISIFVSVLCMVIRLVLARQYNVVRLREYASNVFVRIGLVTILALPIPLYLSAFYTDWIALFSTSLSFLALFSLVTFYVGLTRTERNKIYKLLKTKLQQIKR